MAGPDFVMTCEDIKKDLKSFLEDLLKEEEYQAFLKHMEGCPECKKYVSSVDSFSNQLRKLADVAVPADFCSTVLFKLKQPVPQLQPEPEAEPALEPQAGLGLKSDFPLKLLIGGGLLFFAAATLFLGISYFKRNEPKSPQQDANIPRTPVVKVEEQQGPTTEDDQAYELQSDVPDDAIGFLEIVEEDSAVEADSGEPELLHWHFLLYDKAKELEALRLRRKKYKLESDLKERKEEKKQLEAEIESLKDSGAEVEIQQELELVKQLEDTIKGIEDENGQIEAGLDQNLNETRRKEGEPLNIIKSIGIQPDYHDNDFLLFATSGAETKKILDEIALISKGSSALEDFTSGVRNLSDQDYKVSVYIEKRETLAEHWHVNLAMMSQRTQFINALQERGGVVTYEFAQEMTFSIPESRIADLEAQMPAMRIILSKYGNRSSKETLNEAGEMIDEPVVISAYFSK